MNEEGARLLAEIEAKRGYVHEYHRVLADADPAFLRAYEGFLSAAYTDERSLDRLQKELVFLGVLTGLGAAKNHIAAHMRVASELGMGAREVLEALELCLPPAGVPKFMNAFDAWTETFPPGTDKSRTGEEETA
jgi:4-carboxymuconolactone decarboxylase